MAGRSESNVLRYILRSIKTGRYYIGSTNDLARRLSEHNRGITKSIRSGGVWEIIYKEQYIAPLDARRREIKIKSYIGGNAFKKLIAGVV